MTLALAWNLVDYALLAADTRLTVFPADGSDATFDEYRKVIEIPIGLLTGSGLNAVLDPMAIRIGDMDHKDLPGLPAQLRHISEDVQEGLPPGPLAAHGQRTGLILARARKGRVVVDMYHSDDGYEPFSITPGMMATLLPEPKAQPELEPYELKMVESGLRLLRFRDIDASIDHHLSLLVAFMKRACLVSSLLSESIHVGILFGNDARELPDQMDLSDFEVEALEL
jgi:hypothetical protein